MGNCLVTKLKGVVDNNSLLKMDEIKMTPLTDCRVYLTVVPGQVVNVRTSDGGNHLNNGVNSVNMFISGDLWSASFNTHGTGYDVIINNKYNIENLNIDEGDMEFDGDSMYFCDNLKSLELSKHSTISKVNKNTLKQVRFKQDGFNLALLDGVPLSLFSINNPSSFGDVANLNNLNLIENSRPALFSGDFYGNINHIISATNIERLLANITEQGGTQTGILSGDLSLGASTLKVINTKGRNNTSFTWETARNTSYPAIALVGDMNLGSYVDAMLKNQAQCNLNTGVEAENKGIVVKGEHNPLDAQVNAAIATIKAAGWTIYINDELM